MSTAPGLSEQDFRIKSDAALEETRRSLMPLSDQHGFELEMQNGVLNVVFEEPSEAKFVISPNAPVRQVWVSAMAKGYKLGWSDTLNAFALDGETLSQMVNRLVRAFLRLSSR